MILHARHYQTLDAIEIHIENDVITAVIPKPEMTVNEIVAPAYFDLQINGARGISFTDASLTMESVELVAATLRAHGVSAFCPTVLTASDETIAASLSELRNAVDTSRSLARAMPCFHLEGPFISAEDGPRGAHPRNHVQQANWELFQRWQDAADGRIKLVTLAPEVAGALSLIEKLVKQNIIVSIGHSAGPVTAIRDAVHAGARLSTHLGNGCARMLPRHENILWEQLACDSLHASLITDGHHLPWNVVKCFERSKQLEKLIITCDASPLAGLPAGVYSLWDSSLQITPDRKIVLTEQGVLAGSWDFTAACVEKYMHNMQHPFHHVHPLACDHPRRLLNLPVPSLEVDQPADLVFLVQDLQGNWKHTRSIIQGKVIPYPIPV
ncbi:MAG: N-acetylglucosamine-6-phosphate deacetylase [Planctomycetia bacterium]|nr:N-acetylglucosamine-6-phosphate deacetylase [Planctomycetia bacterium]